MATASAGELAARLDQLPMTRHIWVLVTLISLGGAFEFYDLFLTAYIAPGLVKAGYFTPQSLGPFSVLAPGSWSRIAVASGRIRNSSAYRIASMPLRRMTLSNTSAGPLGRLAPRSNCDT
jgi:hypothetical protein